MKIEFVNHASFIIEHNGVRVISDPWLFGSAFQDGWDLLCPYEFDMDRFKDIQYIWFSHEHPDHFSPPVIQKIKEEYRENITVLFQETKDKKVIDYCTKMGFKVKELPNHKKVTLEQGLEIMCGSVLFFDSWLCFYANDQKILNVNDCIVDGEIKAKEIVKYTGTADVLLTQFSYAAWKGAPEDKALRLASAKNKLDIMQKQMKVFAPKYTIPFASYIYFSHEENKYLNDGINTPQDAYDTIKANGSEPVVLYPEDIWDINNSWDSASSLDRYAKLYDGIESRAYNKAKKTLSVDELLSSANKYIARIKEKNNFSLISLIRNFKVMGFFQAFIIYVYDQDKYYLFDIKKGLVPTDQKKEFDVRIHSECLDYVFRFDWGFDTLTVNGRFESDLEGFAKMAKNFAIGPLNNTGRHVGMALLFDWEIISKFMGSMKSFLTTMKQANKETA